MKPTFSGRPRCAHCGERATLAAADLKSFSWVCGSCDAKVGCHKGGFVPLGRPGVASLRLMRVRLHEHFDPIWRHGDTSRQSAYRWLATKMRINPTDCHIGMFDERQCRQALEIVKLRVGDPYDDLFDDLVDSN